MKTKSLFFVILTLVVLDTSPAAAEDRLHLGVLGGLNLASAAVSPVPPYDFSRSHGVNVGGFVEYNMTPTLSLEARGMYIRKREQAEGPNRDFRGTISIDYLSFPVLLKAKANRITWKPFAVVGAEMAFKTNAKAVLQAYGWQQEDDDFDEDVRSADFALNFGGGIEIPRGGVSFRIEGLYSLGLVNLVAIPDDQYESVRTRTFLVNVGVGF